MQFGEVKITSSSLTLSYIDKRGSWACALVDTDFLNYTKYLVVLN